MIFCFFFSQDVFGDLWLGGRQAVDHLEADLIWDLVLDPGFIAHIQLYFFCTSNCISSAHPTVFLSAFQLVCFWCCIAMCIVACFRLFYCSLTRWGFHTPVKQMVMTIVMMRTGEKLHSLSLSLGWQLKVGNGKYRMVISSRNVTAAT